VPLVTIVIPSYNHELFIADAIKSVISQSYEEIELIIIDDGSSDESVKIIESFTEKCQNRFKNFIFVSRENKGLPRTLNEALEHTAGKYFAMLSSDDILLKEKTSKLVEYLEKHESIAGIFAGIHLIDENRKPSRTLVPKEGIWSFSDILNKKCNLYAPTMMVRTSALKEVGGYWEDVKLEDRAMLLKLSYAGFKFATIPDVVANYRWHQNNNVKNTLEMTEARLSILNKFPQTKEIQIAKSKALHGAAREFAFENKSLGWRSFYQAIKIYKLSALSKASFRAIKQLLIGRTKT